MTEHPSIAHELITRGWTQHTFEDQDGRVCLSGAAKCAYLGDSAGMLSVGVWKALAIATDELWLGLRTTATGYEVGASAYGPGVVILYNDSPARTFDEVLRVAKRADELLWATE